jgi:hypothetical protein
MKMKIDQATVEAFNENHPVGSKVTVIKDDASKFDSTVKQPAQMLGGHTPVVWVEGIVGCYLLSRVV